MLVINSNNQQDTINYMLTDPWYPDIDSILMRGWPQIDKYITANTTVTWQWINDSTIIDTIWTEPINFYCPKLYKSGLRQWNLLRSTMKLSSWFDIPIDFGARIISTSAISYTVSGDTWYRIAIKWLSQWQVIWEKIYAPIMFVCSHNNVAYIQGTLTITFGLLHSDWTKTTIATITPSRVWWTDGYVSWNLLKSWSWNYPDVLSTSIRAWNYDWTWQTAQNGDILFADVIINWMKIYSQSSSTYMWQWCGICFGWTNNNSIWDWNGFRPFQVSIR